ncbi:MAG: pyridoxamine 5'-phosphate oxidase family protein [Bacillota bacterium]|nr:pyridoxamine 5'-phosphate oxidase family protein [Bacillota bacterium]MDW7683241.1 pyridoxamine 5'-phosphate oxidase family protein [Bacillota bacterium]
MSIVITSEMKEVIEKSAFIPIVSLSGDGKPHLIVVGKAKEIREDGILVFGVYKMEKTRENLGETGVMQAAVVLEKKGYRFSGKGQVEGDKVLLHVESAELLL